MTVLRTADGVRQDFISKDIPAGHDTLWGWAAKWSPQDIPAKLDPATAFASETNELLEKSAAEGYSVVDVEAPLALRALGAEKFPPSTPNSCS